jgi:hypothetical protein
VSGALPEDVERFIAEHIHSVEQLEVLLLLQGSCPQPWDAERVARELRTSRQSAASRLDDLRARRLLSSNDGSNAFFYAPASPELDRDVVSLRAAYAERRIAVINAIFAKPSERFDAMRQFADAFRIRKGQ